MTGTPDADPFLRGASTHRRPGPPAVPGGRPPVNARSVWLGLACVVTICAVAPYNDWVISNTYAVGNYLPVGLLLMLTALVLVVNAPLSRFTPRLALSFGELGVVCAMALVSCTVAGSGLMRYLPSQLVAVWQLAAENGDYRQVMVEHAPPDWLFPTFVTPEARAGDVIARANDPVVRHFWARVPVDDDAFTTRWRAVPWGAWGRPAAAWAVLVFAVYGAVTFALLIARRQWAENERLPFPLAGVYLSLIEPPEPGRALNALFRSRTFWVAAGGVFVAHGLGALHVYWPRYWPDVPLRFDLLDVTAERPFSYLDVAVRQAKVYFTVVGITFFLQAKVAFSLWFVYVLANVARMTAGGYGTDLTFAMRMDQLSGAVVPFMAAVVWVGRRHWALVARQMLRGARPGDASRGRYVPYAAAGWGLVACLGVCVAWLVAAGATVAAAVVTVATLLTLFLAAARIVAETGFVFVMLPVPLGKWWTFLGADFGASGAHTTGKSFLLAGTLYNCLGDQRESLPGFMTSGLRIGDAAAYDREPNWRRAVPFVLCLFLALGVAYVVAGASMLYNEYAYAVTLDKTQTAPVNWYAMTDAVTANILGPASQYRPPDYGTPTPHDRWLHVGIGAGVTTLLSVLRLRFDWWPLHPVGYLVVYSWALSQIWFSVFLGWLAKGVVVRLGGASLFRAARPLCIGLIMGETLAAGCWLLMALVRHAMGLPYESIMLLPN